MAIFIPSIEDENSFESVAEQEIYLSFLKLPDNIIIFHSFLWKRKTRFQLVQGEADFIVYYPGQGLIVIEVKGGMVSFENTSWWITKLDTNERRRLERAPLEQADETKYRIIEELKDHNIRDRVNSAVWFPFISFFEQELPLNMPYEVTLWKEDLNNPLQTINRLFKNFGGKNRPVSKQHINKVVTTLMPNFSAIPSRQDMIGFLESQFYRMTNEQAKILNYLVDQREAAIVGGAGTGKTILALEKARRLSEKGRVLFLCFNIFLREDLRERVKGIDKIEVHNLESFLKKYSGIRKDDYFTTDEITKYLDDEALNDWEFHHIIIDEGQDFFPKHIELLQAIAQIHNGFFYIFYDRNQLVQMREENPFKWQEKIDCRLVLYINCRNTKNIAETSYSVLELENLKLRSKVEGYKPTFKAVVSDDKENYLNEIEKLIDNYLEAGFKHDNITVLTLGKLDDSLLNGLSKIGEHRINTMTRAKKQVFFTTARKFKGLESDIIIIIDLNKGSFKKEEDKRLFYVATSRAKLHLDLIFQGKKVDQEVFIASLTKKDYKHLKPIIEETLKVKVLA